MTHNKLWKNANVHQRGSFEYNDGVSRFTEYDRDLRGRLAAYQGINVETGPKSIDAVLDELLDKVDLTGFAQAIHIANSADPTFYQAMVQGMQNHNNQFFQAPQPTFQTPRAQYNPGYGLTPYGFTDARATENVSAYRPTPSKTKQRPAHDYQNARRSPFRDFNV